MKKIFLILFALIAVNAAVIVGFFMMWKDSAPVRGKEVEYRLMPGFGLKRVAGDLERIGVIQEPLIFEMYVRWYGVDTKLQTGTYVFGVGLKPDDVVKKLVTGDVYRKKLVIPEGYNVWEVMEELEKNFPRTPAVDWEKVFLQKTNLKVASEMIGEKVASLEGFIFPATYHFDPYEEPNQIVMTFLNKFKEELPKNFEKKARERNLSAYDALTLASIVEKESSLEKERGLVAAVYLNRLRIRMRLQADPTILYGIQKRQSLKIYKEDIFRETPYNTYVIYGLPKGPVSNPGKASLLAVLNPPKSDDLYFVARGDGGHVFSKNLKEHNAAVKKYILNRKRR